MYLIYCFSLTGCGIVELDTLKSSAKVRTAAEIQKISMDMQNFNMGLYMRSQLMNQTKGDGIEMRVPLYLLSHFFDLDVFYPLKRLLTIDLSLNKSCKNLIKDTSDTNDYEVVIKNAYLDLSWVTLESGIRSNYYDLIDKEKLVRLVSSTKESHFSLQSGSSVYFLPNITPFGLLPSFITLLLLPDTVHLGNWSNRFRYSVLDIDSIEIFIDGNPSYLNDRLRNLDLSSEMSMDVTWLYRLFLSAYGTNAKHITLKTFFTDFFCITLPTSALNCGISEDAMPLVRSGSINLSLTLKSNTSRNYVLIVLSNYKSLVKIDVTGEVLESE